MSSTREPTHVLELADVDASMTEDVGGKAANLGELLRIGAAVPPGFCVTTRAYAEICTGLVDPEGSPAENRAALLAAEFTDQLREEIRSAHTALGTDIPLAVRSSATAEDLPHASFAGQQDTFLNVLGEDALLDAIRHCWSSLWTDRAAVYRERTGIEHGSVRLAVVVQRMVDAEVSGVLCTANPVTGRRGESVIDANTGLGESVVSGAVDPDRFIVETATQEITSRVAGEKQVRTRPKPGGGTETTAQPAGGLALTDERVRELTALGAELERHYQWPQDIEWAISGATVWLTQTRPVTTLLPLPEEQHDGLRMYFSFNVGQGVFRPITPMGLSLLREGAAGIVRALGLPLDGPSALRFADGWMYLDITAAMNHPWGRRLVPRFLSMVEARTRAIVDELKDDPRLATPTASRARMVRIAAGVLTRTRLPLLAVGALLNPARARTRAWRIAEEIRSEAGKSADPSAESRLRAARKALGEVAAPRAVRGLMPRLVPVLVLSQLVPRLLGDSATSEQWQSVLRGIPHNVTTDMDLELWRIAHCATMDERSSRLFHELTATELVHLYRERTLPQSVQFGLESFFATYGHRAVAEIDAGVPRWSEEPDYVLDSLAHYVRIAASGHSADEQYRRGADEAEATARRITQRIRAGSALRARLAAFAMGRVRGLIGLRELPKFCLVLGIAAARENLHAVGKSLHDSGVLDAAEDIFFLSLDEAAVSLAGIDQRELVRRRKETYQRESRRRRLPRILLSDGTEPAESTCDEAGIRGTSAAAGTVTGTARVVHDPAGARLSPGDILVAPSTDPGWTPLFLTAGGLVMEMGGPNSHGATVAREYGIPAVVGVPDATRRISTGQRITVHGSTGHVVPAEDTSAPGTTKTPANSRGGRHGPT